jgi:oligosaccharide repeat unit polymerase
MSDFPITAIQVIAPDDHALTSITLGNSRDLPLYCNPIALFLAVWLLMLACLSVHVSYVIYPFLSTPLLIFAISFGALLLGYFASTAVFQPAAAQTDSTHGLLDVTTLWRLNLLLCSLALSLIAFNWLTAGPPPAIGDPTTYLTYGKFKQVLFPLLTTVAVNATLDSSRLRRYLFIAFALVVLAIYIARGIMLITFLQMFFLFSLRTNMSRRKQYSIALSALIVAVAGMTIIGNLRTAHDVFIEFLGIRDKYSDWPMAFLWVTSYISIPFSNLCWMVAHGPAHGPTLAFLYPMLPTFMAPADPYSAIYGNSNIIDGASTYLQTYALDFSYLGIYFANLLLGVGCGWLIHRAYPRHILILAIFLTSMALIFFTDMFFLLSIFIQLFIQRSVERRCFLWDH